MRYLLLSLALIFARTSGASEEFFDGSLAAGAPIPTESRLCETCSSSRTAVREAIRQLELPGLVDSRQGSRRTVAELDEIWNLNLLEGLLPRGGELDAHILEVRRDSLSIIIERAAARGPWLEGLAAHGQFLSGCLRARGSES